MEKAIDKMAQKIHINKRHTQTKLSTNRFSKCKNNKRKRKTRHWREKNQGPQKTHCN